jgi:transcriptional regulator with XRE-family HTH domain
VRAIRKLRVKKGLSVNKASIRIGTNKSTLTALENGRINLTDDWIEKIIKGYGFNKSSYLSIVNSKEQSTEDLIKEIVEIASTLSSEKLTVIKNLLLNF